MSYGGTENAASERAACRRRQRQSFAKPPTKGWRNNVVDGRGSQGATPGSTSVVKWRANIALFVGTEVAYVAFFAATVQATPAIALTILALALAFTFPFLPIYLGLLATLPRH